MTKPTVILSPLHHKSEQRIKVECPFDEVFIAKIQQIEGRQWSKTHQCWHVPYSADAFHQLRELFEVIIPSELAGKKRKPAPAMPSETETGELIRLEQEGNKRIKAYVPWQRKDWIEKIKTIPGRAWNENEKYWSLPLSTSVARQLKEWFGEQVRFSFDLPHDIPEVYLPKNWKTTQPETVNKELPLPQAAKPNPPTSDELVVIARFSPDLKDLAFLKVPPGQKDWIAFLKTIPDHAWRPADRLWTVPKTAENAAKCKAFFGEKLIIDSEPPLLLNPLPAIKPSETPTAVPANRRQASKLTNTLSIQPVFQSIEKNGLAGKAVIGEYLTVQQLNDKWLTAYVPFDKKDWLEQVKTIRGRTWEPVEKYWKLPYSKETLTLLRRIAPDRLALAFIPLENIPDRVFIPPGEKTSWQQKPALFEQLTDKQKAAVSALEKQLTLERKSYNTIKGYRNHIIQFFYFFRETLPSQISEKQIRDYFYKRIKTDEVARSTQSGFYSALKAFYERVLEMPDKLKYVERPPKESHLPRDLEVKEVERLIQATDNIKHKCMLAIMYGGGLRVGELVRLHIEDVDIEAKTVFISNSKNNKDRFTLFGAKVIPIFLKYLAEYKPKNWLFESPDGGHYSERSVQEVFSRSLAKAGIRKKVSTHSFRHSFATHKTAKGIDLDFLRKLMGHSSIKTTQIYLHVTKERLLGTSSPIDDLDI